MAPEPEAAPPPARRRPSPRAETWERREGLRATFLLHAANPRERASYRRLGQILYDGLLARGDERPEPPGGWSEQQLGAVLSELRFLAGYLGDMADVQQHADLRLDVQRGRAARVLAQRLARLADGLVRTLAAEGDSK